jgi:hypothetical protein
MSEAKRDSHLKKATLFGEHLEEIITSKNPSHEWILIVAFYRALHLFEAGIIGSPPKAGVPQCNTHSGRKDYLRNHKPIRDSIGKEYRNLQSAAEIARYDIDGAMDKYPLGKIQTHALNHWLNKIEQWCEDRTKTKLLKQDYSIFALETIE